MWIPIPRIEESNPDSETMVRTWRHGTVTARRLVAFYMFGVGVLFALFGGSYIFQWIASGYHFGPWTDYDEDAVDYRFLVWGICCFLMTGLSIWLSCVLQTLLRTKSCGVIAIYTWMAADFAFVLPCTIETIHYLAVRAPDTGSYVEFLILSIGRLVCIWIFSLEPLNTMMIALKDIKRMKRQTADSELPMYANHGGQPFGQQNGQPQGQPQGQPPTYGQPQGQPPAYGQPQGQPPAYGPNGTN